jgi:hypothetical protein
MKQTKMSEKWCKIANTGINNNITTKKIFTGQGSVLGQKPEPS